MIEPDNSYRQAGEHKAHQPAGTPERQHSKQRADQVIERQLQGIWQAISGQDGQGQRSHHGDFDAE